MPSFTSSFASFVYNKDYACSFCFLKHGSFSQCRSDTFAQRMISYYSRPLYIFFKRLAIGIPSVRIYVEAT